MLARRAGTGLAAGAVTIVAFPITQIYGAHPGAIAIGSLTNLWWPLASAAALVALVAAAPAVVRAARLRPQAAGPAGDLLADLGRLQPVAARNAGGSVNRLAFVIGTGLAIVIALAGVAANDPYDGILRGLLEASAFFGGYAISESGVEATPIKDRRSSPLTGRVREKEVSELGSRAMAVTLAWVGDGAPRMEVAHVERHGHDGHDFTAVGLAARVSL